MKQTPRRNEVELCFFPRRVPYNIFYTACTAEPNYVLKSGMNNFRIPPKCSVSENIGIHKFTEKSGRTYSKHNCSSGKISQMGTFK